jgi:phosphonate transport system substrate-binding protein
LQFALQFAILTSQPVQDRCATGDAGHHSSQFLLLFYIYFSILYLLTRFYSRVANVLAPYLLLYTVITVWKGKGMETQGALQTIRKRLSKRSGTFAFLWIVLFSHANAIADIDVAAAPGNTLTFGIVPQQSAGTLARLWTPLLENLSATTGYQITFKTAPDIPEFERRLAAGMYDLAYMNPYHYTTFHQQPGYRAFARAKDKKLQGIIVVRADSPHQQLADLAGQTLAFPSPAAFAASIVTRANLQNQSTPFEAKYVSSHDSVYRSVARGLYPAGGGVMRTFNNIEEDIRKQLRILWISPGYTPHAFAAHPRLDSSVVDTIQAAMVQLDQTVAGRTLLGNLKLKGITPASDGEWNDIRDMNLQILSDLISISPKQQAGGHP